MMWYDKILTKLYLRSCFLYHEKNLNCPIPLTLISAIYIYLSGSSYSAAKRVLYDDYIRNSAAAISPYCTIRSFNRSDLYFLKYPLNNTIIDLVFIYTINQVLHLFSL